VEVSRELRLTIDCCRSAFAGGRPDISGGIAWHRFLRTTRFHRVEGLVWSSLRKRKDEIPTDVAESLAADSTSIAARSLRASAECSELATDLERARIPFLFLKGLTLGALAYGNPALKAAADIDLLVAPERILDTAQLLHGRGYGLEIPKGRADPRRLSTWHKRRKESLWTKPNEWLAVDLHSRVADSSDLIPTIGVSSPHQLVEVAPGTRLPTLATDELFAYLCVHGASSAWFRLKWIADFSALVHRFPASEIERLYERSQELGAACAAGQALLLADRLFGPIPATELTNRLLADRNSRWLADAALRQLAERTEPREPSSTLLGTLRIHWTQLLLKAGPGFKAKEVIRQIRDAIA
jgi:hypothetical protein